MAKIDSNENCPCNSGLLFKDCHELKIKTRMEPNITQSIKLSLITEPDPGTRSVFEKTSLGTIVFSGNDSNIAFVCGKCDSQLIVGVNPDTINNIVIQCNKCMSFNNID